METDSFFCFQFIIPMFDLHISYLSTFPDAFPISPAQSLGRRAVHPTVVGPSPGTLWRKKMPHRSFKRRGCQLLTENHRVPCTASGIRVIIIVRLYMTEILKYSWRYTRQNIVATWHHIAELRGVRACGGRGKSIYRLLCSDVPFFAVHADWFTAQEFDPDGAINYLSTSIWMITFS